jgi:hypothetical protein
VVLASIQACYPSLPSGKESREFSEEKYAITGVFEESNPSEVGGNSG